MKMPAHLRSMIGLVATSIIPFFAPMTAHAIELPTTTLAVTISLTNNNGGTLNPATVPVFVDLLPTTLGTNTISAGTHTVSATAQAGYTMVIGGDCDVSGSITLVDGDSKTCTITMDDIAPQLTVIKTVINDDEGELSSSDFLMQVTGTNVSSASFPGSSAGTVVTMDAGSYSVDEGSNIFGGETAHGYTKSIGEGCSGTLAIGETATCTITNDDPEVEPTMGTIRIFKTVINDNGGTLRPQDFIFTVHDSDEESPDQNVWIVEEGAEAEVIPGEYTVTESPYLRLEELRNTYTATYSEGCTGTIEAGETVTCYITNNDPGSPTPPSGGGGVPPPIPSDLNPAGFPTAPSFVPTPVDAPAPAGGPRVLGTEDTSSAIATCRAQDPDSVLVTSNLDDLLHALNLPRNGGWEKLGDALVPKVVPTDAGKNDRLLIRNFTAYGAHGLEHLGAGERAGVINSFRAVYHRLPKTECDWQDALRIARGLMPLTLSPTREQEAQATFRALYGHAADQSIAAERQTFLIMAYGLRPAERDLAKERLAIQVFVLKIGHHPRNASEWDAVRGMTYGGLELPR